MLNDEINELKKMKNTDEEQIKYLKIEFQKLQQICKKYIDSGAFSA